jgi:hypothetical protein
MGKMRRLINSRMGAWMGGGAGLLFLAMVTVGHAATEPPKTGQGEQKPAQGQHLCPPPGAQQCQVRIDCPPVKAPGKTVCRATFDCPPAPKKKQK